MARVVRVTAAKVVAAADANANSGRRLGAEGREEGEDSCLIQAEGGLWGAGGS